MFKVVGLISVASVLFWVGYSLLGGTPLLIAKYETPNDSRFVRGFFHVHYVVLILLSAFGSISFYLAENRLLTFAMLFEIAVGLSALLFLIARMDRLRGVMAYPNKDQVPDFRKLVSRALALNLLNILVIFWFLAQSALITCTKTPPDCNLGQKIDGQVVNCTHVCSLF